MYSNKYTYNRTHCIRYTAATLYTSNMALVTIMERIHKTLTNYHLLLERSYEQSRLTRNVVPAF